MNSVILFFKKNWKFLAGIVLFGVFIAINRIEKQDLRQQIAVGQHNTEAILDSVRKETDRAGRETYVRLSLLTNNVNALSKLNKELAEEVKKVQGNVSTIIQGDVKIVEKPVPVFVQSEIRDSTVYAFWKYDSIYSPGNYKKLSGYTAYNLKNQQVTGEKTTDEIGVKFITGIKDLDKGKPEIFLTSEYPGFKVTELQGAVLDPKLFKKDKQKRLGVRLFAGYAPLYYNISSKKFGFANQVAAGAGLTYKIF